jgi:hypothetical protein
MWQTKTFKTKATYEKWAWLKIVSFTLFMLSVAMFGPDLLKFLNN